MEFRSFILVCCLICSTVADEDIIGHNRKNPIINLFEAPLRAFNTQPGEAIAVFQPELLRQANINDTNGVSSWFQAGQNIGSAAGALTGWIRNRISTPTTTHAPEVIVEVHQGDRPQANNNHVDRIRLEPSNTIVKRKQQLAFDDIDDDLDRIDEELDDDDNNNDDDDDDENNNSNNDSNENDNFKNRVNQIKIRKNQNRNHIDKDSKRKGGSSNRNFNNNVRYEYDDDEDDEDQEVDDDDSYRDYEDDDIDDSQEDGYHNYVESEVYYDNNRRKHPIANNNRKLQNRRPIKQFNHDNRPPIRNIQQNEFYRPFQDMPPLAKPIRYGLNNNDFQPQVIGVLKQKQMIQRRKQQQQKLQQQKLQQQQQQKIKGQQLQAQQLLFQQQQQIRPQQLDFLLNNQQHVLIPVQFLPNSLPYSQILPQIQVVSQHHYANESPSSDTESPTTEKPNRKRPNRRPAAARKTTTAPPIEITRTTQQPTTRPITTRLTIRKPEKGNKFQINRRKPTTTLKSDPPTSVSDENRPDATPPIRNGDKNNAEKYEEEQMPMYTPPEPIMEPELSETNNNDEDILEKEPKSGDTRAQYYLPQSYYKILGSNSYLALNNNGRFLLRTGRRSGFAKKDVVIRIPDNDDLKNIESTKEEKLVSAPEVLTKPIIEVQSTVGEAENKTEIEEQKVLPLLPVSQLKSEVEEVEKIVKEDEKELNVEIKEVVEKENEDKTLKLSTENPLLVVQVNPVIVKKEELVHVDTIIKPTEKVILRSEVVQEKPNGNFIIKSENAATLPKVDSITIEKITKTEPTKETS